MFRAYSIFLILEIILKEFFSILKKEDHYVFSIYISVFSLASIVTGNYLTLFFVTVFILSYFFYKNFFINNIKRSLDFIKNKKEYFLISEMKKDEILKKYKLNYENLKEVLASLNEKKYNKKDNYSTISLYLEERVSLDINTFNILGYKIGRSLNKKYSIEEFREDLKTGDFYSIGVPYKLDKKYMNIENIDLITYKMNSNNYINNFCEKTIEINEFDEYFDIFSLDKNDFNENKIERDDEIFSEYKFKTNKKDLKNILIANLLFIILFSYFMDKTILNLILGLFLSSVFYSLSKIYLVKKENKKMTQQKLELLGKNLKELKLEEYSNNLVEVSLFYKKEFANNSYSYYLNKDSNLKGAYVNLMNENNYSDNKPKTTILLEYNGKIIEENYMKYRKDYNFTEKGLLDENVIKMYLMTAKI